MPKIHPTAIIEPSVRLADDVTIGAYATLKGDVTIGRGTIVKEHSYLEGSTLIGEDCQIGPAAYVGLDPQHARFKHDSANPSFAKIGNRVIIREGASVHRAFHPGIDHATTVGDDCFLMGQSHVGHDCHVDVKVTLVQGALLGGHCEIGPGSTFGGGCVIHQFCRVGRLVIIAGNEAVSRDIPPFAAVRYGGLKGYNAIGCRRAGLSRESISLIRAIYQHLHTHRTVNAAVAAIKSELPDNAVVREMLEFIATSKRGLQPSVKGRANGLDDVD